ncbi:hypothetical protein M1O47_00810 [Dehalococcoidia bacterium]|nr:hypothetical protein [Dehalococcoidia bacterium]MCL0058218.1 hypothetical protein [Dehalococcoidia bacterium]
MLSPEVIARLFNEEDILGLKFATGVAPVVAYFEIKTVEGPINLKSYALGTAALAQNVVGTGWDEIKDAAGRLWLEPEFDSILFHIFFGINPDYAWIYQRYPPNVDRGSLIGTREIGGKVGAISGFDSPFRNPSPHTEFFTVRGAHPSFLGYHPYLEPASTLVHLNFFVIKYGVNYLGYPGHRDEQPSEEQMERAVIRTLGGEPPVPLPEWLR